MIHPSITFLLLEVTTRVLLLLNYLTSANNGGSSKPMIADDSLVIGILQRAPHNTPADDDEVVYTSTSIIEKCIHFSGESARVELAKLFPYYCLTDESIQVRQSALEGIGKYPELVKKYYNDVLVR